MTLTELKELMSLLGSLGFGVFLGAGVVYLLLRFLLPSYISEKGKNLATREDIAAITHQIEEVKSQYAQRLQELSHQNTLLIENVRSQSQLRLAAAERRLDTHQRAFTLWRKLVSHVHSEKCSEVVNECHRFWEENCIFLSPEAREALSDAYFAANNHAGLLQDRRNPQAVTANWDRIVGAGTKIVEGADLPPLGQRELQTPGQTAPMPNPALNTDARQASLPGAG